MAIDQLNASNESGEAVRASVTALRTAGSTVITVNSLTNWPTKFIATSGALITDSAGNSKIDPTTAFVFAGHKSGSTIVIDTIAPGYTDIRGNIVGDVVVLKPTTMWADALVAAIQNLYPVGSVYTNAAVATNPATLLGFGTWTAFGAGRVPVGFDNTQTEFNAIGKTGGEKVHLLTTAELPAHAHLITDPGHSHTTQSYDVSAAGTFGLASGGGAQRGLSSGTNSASTGITTTQNAGSGGSHNNLQPYVTVYMWQRTA